MDDNRTYYARRSKKSIITTYLKHFLPGFAACYSKWWAGPPNRSALPLSGFQTLTGVNANIPDLFRRDARRCVSTQRPRNNMKPATRNKMRSNLEMDQAEIILYQFGDQSTMLEVRVEDETVWLNQAQLALH